MAIKRPPSVFADGLTDRQLEVLVLVSYGLSDIEIVQWLGISRRTVHVHVCAVFQRLRVNNRAEAIAKATALGIIDEYDAFLAVLTRRRREDGY